MRINPISLKSTDNKNLYAKKINFGTYNPGAAKRIEDELARKGFSCDFRGNDFVAECYKKTAAVFQKLFGSTKMPSKFTFKSLGDGVFGAYNCVENEVSMNKDFSYGCFYDMDKLKAKAKSLHGTILPGWNSSGHPGHVFMHEFGHAAHWHNLVERNGADNAKKVWTGLVGTTVPTGIGKLISKFKLSKYAVESDDMCEFMAERIAKDVCESLTDNSWETYKSVDVNYSNIFSRKWDYRYSSPQSYVDYFTQQVWNGDIEGAKRAGQLAEEYLKEIESVKVAPVVQKVATKIDYTPKGTTQKTKPLIYKMGSFLSKKIVQLNKTITENLDEKNKLDVHKVKLK